MWVWMLAGTFWSLFAMSVAWLIRRRRSLRRPAPQRTVGGDRAGGTP
jgi:hypothetical protein